MKEDICAAFSTWRVCEENYARLPLIPSRYDDQLIYD